MSKENLKQVTALDCTFQAVEEGTHDSLLKEGGVYPLCEGAYLKTSVSHAFLRGITPKFVLSLYHRLRLQLRAVSRSLSGVKTCQVGKVTIKVGVASELEHYRAETYATKEPETIDWLDENLRDEDVFMDVGANIGLYSLYAAKLKPTSNIYAFEPESQNFSRLCRNIVLNQAVNIVPCNFPLADREEFDLFYVGTMEIGSALHSFGRPSGFRVGSGEPALRQGAISATLDALVGKFGLPQPTLLKIDVDGLEEKILTGAQMVLKCETLRTVLVELNFVDESSPTRVEQTLVKFGYALDRKGDHVWEQNGMKSRNYIFKRA